MAVRDPGGATLIERAKQTAGPVVDAEQASPNRTIYRAAVERDGTVWRADLTARDGVDSPRVQFWKCHPDSPVEGLTDWWPLATGTDPGPKRLAAWRPLTLAFEAALHTYDRQAQAAESGGGAEVGENA